MILGCDGIFDKLCNKDIVDMIWKNSTRSNKIKNDLNGTSNVAFDIDIH